jgi:hypothetical protein
MSRIKFLGVALVAVFAFAALAATSALAEEKTKMLPESGVTFTGKQEGVGKLVQAGGETIECKKGKGTGTIESANLGKFTTDFEECKLATGIGKGSTCTGAGEASGVILAKGPYHFWLALETLSGKEHTLVGALVELAEPVHFTCVVFGLNQLVVVEGCTAALAKPLNTLSATTEDVFAQSNGVQLITQVLPQEKTSEITCQQLSSLNGGTFKNSALEGTAKNEKFISGGKEITVLLMNPEAKE